MGLSGAFGSGLSGANVGQGFTSSALQGLGVSALGQSIKGVKALAASTEDRLDVINLPEVSFKATREQTPNVFSFLTSKQRWDDHFAYPGQIADAAEWMVSLQANTMLSAIPFGAVAGLGARGTNLVYQGLDAAGTVRYVGITEREAAVRFAEHLNSGTARSLLDYQVVDGATGLSRTAAKVWNRP